MPGILVVAPNTNYISAQEYNREGTELRELIRELHENGIEVILDVVFNHTAEGNEHGPTFWNCSPSNPEASGHLFLGNSWSHQKQK